MTAAVLIPPGATLDEVRRRAQDCTACHLHETGTQTVFGAGPTDAEVILVGEQPGDEEDRAGQPFVGPAGRELDRGLAEAGIDPDRTYVTNAVKHFKWSERRGKRRIHEKPNRIEIQACLPWLDAEISRVAPVAVVALGATAAQALLGSSFRVTRQHGEFHLGRDGVLTTATLHPAAILRAPSDRDRAEARRTVRDDFAGVAKLLSAGLEQALSGQRRERLYGLAQDLDVGGRSSMDKRALAGAVARALSAA